MKDLFEKKIKSEQVFKNKVFDFRCDKFGLPNGKMETREYIRHIGVVCCVPILNVVRVLLIKQYRYAIKNHVIEVPAGKIDKNEKPDLTVMREVQEEMGYNKKKLTFLTKIYTAVGFTNEIMWVYLAENLDKTIPKTDEDEFIQIIPLKFQKALIMIWSVQIRDAKSIIAI